MAKAKKKPAPKRKKAAPKRKPAAKKPPAKKRKPAKPPEAVPVAVEELDTSTRRRAKTAREWATRSSPVVEILDDAYPTGALRRFLDSIKGEATPQQAQIALGAAQLLLLPIAREARGGSEVKEIVDLVLEHWVLLGERRVSFHAREFLRNAFAAVGVDRPRIARLEQLVPADAGPELMVSVAAAHAVARDKVALLRSVEAGLDAGASTEVFRREADFAPYQGDPDFAATLARAELPPIPVDVAPHVASVRAALDSLIGTLREFGELVELRPPVRLDAILDAERARKISLPNDYRALLAMTNGMKLWEHEFLGVADLRDATQLAIRAQRWLQVSAKHGAQGIEDCIPLVSWGSEGSAGEWLVYDPRGRTRGGDPGYVLVQTQDELPLESFASALAWLEQHARDVLGTN